MRCKYCGSASIHSAKEHKNFSTGKAVAGAVAFGVVGAAAGFIGKEKEGHRCGACGAFMETPMDFSTEFAINRAISDAEAGISTSMYNYYKKQYANIQANIPVAQVASSERMVEVSVPQIVQQEESVSQIKHAYRFNTWIPECPIHIESIYIKTKTGKDYLSISALNQSGKVIRSAYFDVVVFDDTGDEVGTCKCVYQNVNIPSNESLPVEQEFELNTNIAYRVSIKCEKVALNDDSVWRWTEGITEYTLPAQNELTDDAFPRFKYVRENLEVAGIGEEPEHLYLPIDTEEYWLCICGRPQTNRQCSCTNCGAEHAKLEALLSQKFLQEKQLEAIKNRAASRAKDTIELYEKAYNKQFEDTYNEALEEEAKNTIDSVKKAIELFASVPEWKDASDRKNACEEKMKVLETKAEEERIEAEKKAEEDRIAAEIAQKEKAKKIKLVSIIAGAAVLVLIIGAIIFNTVIKPANAYADALAKVSAGEYDEAYAMFEELGDYKDSKEQLVKINELKRQEAIEALEETKKLIEQNIKQGDFSTAESLARVKLPEEEREIALDKIEIAKISKAKNGETVEFGKNAYGRELEWLVMIPADGQGRVLIGLDSVKKMKFSDHVSMDTSITWENSNVREWLNGEFYEETFSETEKEVIKEHTTEVCLRDGKFESTVLTVVKDKVYILGKDEVQEYRLSGTMLLRDIYISETDKIVSTAVLGLKGKNYVIINMNDNDSPIVPVIWLDID